ncbi:MAG TPA: PAS domain S-box protein [Bryobacteraceae bacterium]|jgi:PAS domain S-box-containing protein|nr:PAS domain S-box protein [Bryobacteraceae bacterium]
MSGSFSLPPKELFELFVSELNEFVVVLLTNEGIFCSWHAGVERLFGYTAEEFVGQSLDLLLPQPDRLRGDAKAELDHAARYGRASDTRWLQKKGGQPVLVDGLTVALRNKDGELAGFGKIIHDVTERKTTEDNLRALAGALEQSTVLIRGWNGVIEHWTSGCERLYGWTAQEAVGKIEHELLSTKFPAPLDQIEQQLLATGTWQGELEQVRRDGSLVFVSAHWVLLADHSDEPLSIIATHTDISARLQMQQELELANERLRGMALELERSNQELEEFARIASHDLSAPITSTRWLVDLLSSRHAQRLDEEGQRCLKQVSSGLERMSELVEAVLAHARVGKSAIGSPESTEARDALSRALENLRKDIETSGAVIRHDPLPRVNIQPQPLTQLFQNLLSNAIKYARAGVRPEIRISAQREGSHWRFGVHDNGMGIEPEWFERIFLPMQRLHGVEISGSGIGLATCRKIVTRAGGRIWVESKIKEGSSFYFTLPGPAEPRP